MNNLQRHYNEDEYDLVLKTLVSWFNSDFIIIQPFGKPPATFDTKHPLDFSIFFFNFLELNPIIKQVPKL